MNRVRRRAASRSVLVTAISRRALLQRFTAVPAALGLAVFREWQPGRAKQKNGKKGKGNGNSSSARYAPDGEERKFLDLINDYRRKNGAGQLRLQDQLGAAAEHHSQDMAKKNYFSHKLANGDAPEKNIERFGYRDWTHIGENIAAGFETANEVMTAWKKSPEHDRSMRDKAFTEIGIGRAYDRDAKYGWYWTTTFGSRS
ncbi:MAG: CAP domain-containing protein [Thermomicrobiales bacterium]